MRICLRGSCTVLSRSVVLGSLRPQLYPARLLCSWGSSRQEYWSGLPFPAPGDLPDPGTEPGSPALQADSLPAEPSEKPKNTGVGCHSLLQGIFPTQESNPGLLHCRRILYQLGYQGSQQTLRTSEPHSPAASSRQLEILPGPTGARGRESSAVAQGDAEARGWDAPGQSAAPSPLLSTA